MDSIVGTWKQPADQAYPGLTFTFHEDGSFESVFSAMGITSSGTYSVEGDLISMDQSQHNFGLTGKFDGRYAIEGSTLKMAFANPGEAAPEDLSNARTYLME